MKNIFVLIYFLTNCFYAQNQGEEYNRIQIGMYALQAPTGSRGHQNGSLSEIRSEINSVKGVINAAIPYRHWDRVDYPDWDFNEYFLTYLTEMYELTIDPQNLECIQSFTPPMYSSFLDPPVKNMPENDRWSNRNLDYDIFRNYIRNILKKEYELIKKAVKNDEDKMIRILSNPKLRPLGGWYLDDEPFVRNHDIEVIETMSSIIRLLEKEFFHEVILPAYQGEINLSQYLHPRYIAFDGDDLHKYPKSSRKFDGQFYNRNGNTIYFNNNKKYSVFHDDTYDVLLIDFYHNDLLFWQKMLDEISVELNSASYNTISVMPVLNAQVLNEESLNAKLTEIDNLLQLFKRKNLPGFWIYIWDDFDSRNLDAKILWKDEGLGLKEKLKPYVN